MQSNRIRYPGNCNYVPTFRPDVTAVVVCVIRISLTVYTVVDRPGVAVAYGVHLVVCRDCVDRD